MRRSTTAKYEGVISALKYAQVVNNINNHGAAQLSTSFTRSPIAGLPMLESQSLRLMQKMENFRAQQTKWLLQSLAQHGYDKLTPAHVALIGAMDCADNMASELARRLMVSRQAVHRSVRELEEFGYLAIVPNPDVRNSKIIRITGKGEELISTARELFLNMDKQLAQHLNEDDERRVMRLFDLEFEV